MSATIISLADKRRERERDIIPAHLFGPVLMVSATLFYIGFCWAAAHLIAGGGK